MRGKTGVGGICFPWGGGELVGVRGYNSYKLCISGVSIRPCVAAALPGFFSLWRLPRWRKGEAAPLGGVWMFHTVAHSAAGEDGWEDASAVSRQKHQGMSTLVSETGLVFSVPHCPCCCCGSNTPKQCPGMGVFPICRLDMAIWCGGKGM